MGRLFCHVCLQREANRLKKKREPRRAELRSPPMNPNCVSPCPRMWRSLFPANKLWHRRQHSPSPDSATLDDTLAQKTQARASLGGSEEVRCHVVRGPTQRPRGKGCEPPRRERSCRKWGSWTYNHMKWILSTTLWVQKKTPRSRKKQTGWLPTAAWWDAEQSSLCSQARLPPHRHRESKTPYCRPVSVWSLFSQQREANTGS